MHFTVIGIVSTAVVLGALVFFHELAHFIVAKACGVKVEAFSLGFGKRVVGFTYGETEYKICILPLGGYVKMAGEIPGEEASGAPNEFDQHPRWQRALIALAGPTMNVLLAIILLTCVYMFRNEVEIFRSEPVVLDYVAKATLAAQDGFQTGDRVTQIDKVSNPTWDQFLIESELGSGHKVATTVDRGGKELQLTYTPGNEIPWDEGFVPLTGEGPMRVEAAEPGMPAVQAGIQSGDEVLAADAQPIHSIFAFKAYLQDHYQTPVVMTVKRGNEILKLAMQPTMSSDPATGKQSYLVGIRTKPPPVQYEKQALPAAFKHSLVANIQTGGMIYETLHRMFAFRLSPRNLAGPIGIVQVTSETAEQPGWAPLLKLTAMISVNLAIVNLLPFPILDGGVILLLIIESLMRHDLKPQLKERIYAGAFAVLALLFILLIFNDLSRLSLFTHVKT
jgi:regulator of sigma E protease